MRDLPGSKTLGFNDFWLLLIGIPAVAMIMSLITFGSGVFGSGLKFLAICFAMSLVYTTIFWGVFRQLVIIYRKRLPKPESARLRIILQTGTMVIGYFLLKFILDPLVAQLFGAEAGPKEMGGAGIDAATIVIIFLVSSIYEGVYFYNLFKSTELEKIRLEQVNTQTQLEGLKSYVDPHFLFNSLNTLAQLIPEDQVKAERYVEQMSKVYRYILEMRNKKLISLEEELNFLDAYQFLLKERFGEKLHFGIQIDEANLNKMVIPLALQMCIENAIKHNVISLEKNLRIDIETNGNDKLVIKNQLRRKKRPPASTGFGLENIRSRYRYYTDVPVDVITTQEEFIVLLPLLSLEKELAVS